MLVGLLVLYKTLFNNHFISLCIDIGWYSYKLQSIIFFRYYFQLISLFCIFEALFGNADFVEFTKMIKIEPFKQMKK